MSDQPQDKSEECGEHFEFLSQQDDSSENEQSEDDSRSRSRLLPQDIKRRNRRNGSYEDNEIAHAKAIQADRGTNDDEFIPWTGDMSGFLKLINGNTQGWEEMMVLWDPLDLPKITATYTVVDWFAHAPKHVYLSDRAVAHICLAGISQVLKKVAWPADFACRGTVLKDRRGRGLPALDITGHVLQISGVNPVGSLEHLHYNVTDAPPRILAVETSSKGWYGTSLPRWKITGIEAYRYNTGSWAFMNVSFWWFRCIWGRSGYERFIH
ncbi:hypothetical protein VTL71DRAFT_13496 [Oculimacula yallundae]|uniref:Uncharacterized protein n=1 Tax=Oculimacula yallundae TaxID=86028 RepID=A0ABR4CKL5_9HELO